MDPAPLVTIAVPTYNSEATIKETLASIVGQTYRHLDILVSDNASTDRTLEIVEGFRDRRIRIHRQARNIGGERNFDSCWQMAQGEFVAIYHADDVYEPQIVEREVAFLQEHPDVGAVSTRSRFIDAEGRRYGVSRLPASLESGPSVLHLVDALRLVAEHGNFIVCPSVMIRRRICQEELRVWRDDLFGPGCDLDVWLRVMTRHGFGIIPEPLILYRRSNQSVSHRGNWLRTQEGHFFRVMHAYLAEPQRQDALGPGGRRALTRLERKDAVFRASNHILKGERTEAVRVLRNHWSPDMFRYGLEGPSGMRSLLAYIGVAASAIFPRTLRPIARYMSMRGQA